MKKNDRGTIYILSNPIFPKNGDKMWLKIGKTKRPIKVRIDELKTSTPLDFQIEAEWETDDMSEMETDLHEDIRIFHTDRRKCKREFFYLPLATAIRHLTQIAKHRHELHKLIVYKNGVPAYTYDENGTKVIKPEPLSADNDKTLFYLHGTERKTGREWKAIGHNGKDGFIVCKGSTVNSMCDSFKKEVYCYRIRTELEQQGIIKNKTFTRDYAFTSISAAGGVCMSGACQPSSWKLSDGRTYRDIYPAK